MQFGEALEKLKLGKKVTREGRVLQILARGVWDVTEGEPVRVELTKEDRAATDWDEAK